jgi:hypothetical protein
LLVYKWDNLPGPEANKLGEEDENMPAMQRFPEDVSLLRAGSSAQVSLGVYLSDYEMFQIDHYFLRHDSRKKPTGKQNIVDSISIPKLIVSCQCSFSTVLKNQ